MPLNSVEKNMNGYPFFNNYFLAAVYPEMKHHLLLFSYGKHHIGRSNTQNKFL